MVPGQRWVAVVGGATAGAEVAAFLAHQGIKVAVFDQHARPYGKIEDGLPRWHEALRRQEYHHIDEKLDQPNVTYVPLTKVGRDVDFADLATNWGFAAVVLACGAWKDRALPVQGAASFVGRGLEYQNPFVVAFNHANETGRSAAPVKDGALVLGGGLAAIDVAKICMLETTRQALAARGQTVSIADIEHKGIPATLEALGLHWSDLQLAGCTIVYRRQAQDMPLIDLHDPGNQALADKIHKTRLKLLHHAQEKFLFGLQELASPQDIISNDGSLVGMRFVRNKVDGDRTLPTDETFTLSTNLVISAIGSIPEAIKGIPLRGELFDFADSHLGTMAGFPNVFSVGNVVTGRGNIAASRKHAREVSESAVSAFLGLPNDRSQEVDVSQALSNEVRTHAQHVAGEVAAHTKGSSSTNDQALPERIAALQARVGYHGSYSAWMTAHAPTVTD